MWNGRLHSAQERECCFRFPSICFGVFCLQRKQCVVGDGFGSRWIRALGVLWLSGSVTRRILPVLGCPCSCGGWRVTFCPCRCRYRVLSIGLCVISAHFCDFIIMSSWCAFCAMRHISSQASRCLSRVWAPVMSGLFRCKMEVYGRAHPRHTEMGCVFIAFTSAVKTLIGSAGFCCVGSPTSS